ncbi:HlyD family type I secretion periplasmic adaptor subunit [Methylobacterium tarhaniae]|uniref:HlyD family type I secretion periplasmic adaptor subunit n=1 Tax=Methylobacterium tarhaniae TaxID=1187852 RepID=UPI003D03F66E
MQSSVHPLTQRALRRALIGGSAVATLLTFGLGGWAATTDLASAVIAPGMLVVETNVKKVQHPTGGVVGELRVREGTTVRAGEILVRLDETVTRANLTVITKGQDELIARQSRLKAEQNGQDVVSFPAELVQRSAEPSIANLLSEEERLFGIRRAARDGQKSQLRERISQLREQIQGMTDQVKAKQREIDLIGEELRGVRDLFAKNLIQIARVTALERDAARLVGERGAIFSSIAQIKGKVTETELQILQIEQDLRTEVGKELAEIRGKLAELVEKRVAAEDQLKRVEIRAPQDGVVHQLAIHTIGGVITPGEPLMLIVPRADALTIEARIQPHDVDQVRIGHKAILRFSAFNQRTTPEVAGTINMVAADVSHDQKTGASFYTVRIQPASDELKRLDKLKLVAGMPVESFIQTGERTVISYLIKPLADQAAKAWRER